MPQVLLGICSAFFLGTYLFFGQDLLLATQMLVYSSLGALAILLLFFRRTTKRKEWLILAATIVFGAMTIYFNEGDFIKWRTTIVNVVIAFGLVGMFYLKKSPIKMIFAKTLEIELPESEWLRTNLWWAAYMLLMALLNSVIVLMGLSDDIWMTFKMIVNPALTFILSIVLMVYLVKRSKALKEKAEADHQKEM